MDRILFIYEPEMDSSSSDFLLKKIASFYKEDRYKKDENFVLVHPVDHCGSLGDLKVYQEYLSLLDKVTKVVFVLDKSKANLLPLYTAFMKLCVSYNIATDWITDPRTQEKDGKKYYNRGKCEEIRKGKYDKLDVKRCMHCGMYQTCRKELKAYQAQEKLKYCKRASELAKKCKSNYTYVHLIKGHSPNEPIDWEQLNERLNELGFYDEYYYNTDWCSELCDYE